MILKTARLDWHDGQAKNRAFDDIYFSHDGDQEVDRVFLTPSDIDGRLSATQTLTIAELGFGSGRNFVCAAARAAAQGRRLHFISVEAQPLARDDLLKVLHPTRHAALAEALHQHYPPPISGWHRRTFLDGAVTLSLFLGSAEDFVDELVRRHPHGVDAWFLDGFAPAKNPDMWSEPLLKQVGATCRPTASVATFTAAGRVRRCLEAAGFEMRRVDQRPYKRESLAGTLKPGLGRSATLQKQPVHVRGAGIAGCAIAAHFAQAGFDVVISDTEQQPATGASSVVAMQHARLLGDGSALADWRAAVQLYATHFNWHAPTVNRVGALQGTGPNLDAAKLQRIFEAYSGSGDWLQLQGDPPALWFPHAAVVDLPRHCDALLDHANIETQFGAPIPTDIETIYACGARTTDLEPFSTLPIQSLWGQVDLVRADRPQPYAMIGDGYHAPIDDHLVVGSTYEYSAWPQQQATERNLSKLPAPPLEHLGSRRGQRAVAPDRTPIVGSFHGHWLSAAHGSMGATSAYLAAAILLHRWLGWVPPVSAAVEALLDPHRFEARAARRASSGPLDR